MTSRMCGRGDRRADDGSLGVAAARILVLEALALQRRDGDGTARRWRAQ